MCYKLKVVMEDDSVIESRIKLNKEGEQYRDVWLRVSRWFSEIGNIKQIILLEVAK